MRPIAKHETEITKLAIKMLGEYTNTELRAMLDSRGRLSADERQAAKRVLNVRKDD